MGTKQTEFSRRSAVTLLAVGSRGDVQPLVVLALALQQAGQRVKLLAGQNFEPWLRGLGLDVVPARMDVVELMQSRSGSDWVKSGNNPRRELGLMRRLVDEHGAAVAEDIFGACEGADLVISSALTDVIAASLRDSLPFRQVSVVLQPALVATRDGRSTMNSPVPGRESWINYWLGKLLIEPFMWRLFSAATNEFRQRKLRLAPLKLQDYRQRREQMLVLQAYSQAVVPRPADLPANIQTVGYLRLPAPADWQPPDSLQRFLAAGPAPVFVGFGSMTGPDATETTDLVVEAAHRAGVRIVLQAGWAGLGPGKLPETVFTIGDCPHDWLLPRMAAAVHHGGAGTTAAGLAAGLPTLVVPHMADQRFWGQRVSDLGLGPRPVPRQQLTAASLADAMRQAVSDPLMQARCRTLAATLQAEDGCGAALALIRERLEA